MSSNDNTIPPTHNEFGVPSDHTARVEFVRARIALCFLCLFLSSYFLHFSHDLFLECGCPNAHDGPCWLTPCNSRFPCMNKLLPNGNSLCISCSPASLAPSSNVTSDDVRMATYQGISFVLLDFPFSNFIFF